MAIKKVGKKGKTRKETMANGDFHQAFQEAKKFIRSLSVVYVEIENPLELYLFEVFCAMEFDTYEWNTFVTH
jgi:hypothetical protein